MCWKYLTLERDPVRTFYSPKSRFSQSLGGEARELSNKKKKFVIIIWWKPQKDRMSCICMLFTLYGVSITFVQVHISVRMFVSKHNTLNAAILFWIGKKIMMGNGRRKSRNSLSNVVKFRTKLCKCHSWHSILYFSHTFAGFHASFHMFFLLTFFQYNSFDIAMKRRNTLSFSFRTCTYETHT